MCVQVLLNIAKYENTAPAVYDAENCTDTLMELLQIYREKPGDKVPEKSRIIFTKNMLSVGCAAADNRPSF